MTSAVSMPAVRFAGGGAVRRSLAGVAVADAAAAVASCVWLDFSVGVKTPVCASSAVSGVAVSLRARGGIATAVGSLPGQPGDFDML